jgi:N-acyl-D-amino-acid deacylase
MRHYLLFVLLTSVVVVSSCGKPPAREYDVVLRNGKVYDGTGGAPYLADIAIDGDIISAIGDLNGGKGKAEYDLRDLAVAPGFINMLSQATESLIADGRSQSDIFQGVTTEIFGEGESMGPWSDAMKADVQAHQGDIKYKVEWNTLGEYLRYLAKKGVSPNVASFVGATTVRQYVLGNADRAPTPAELDKMRDLVRQAMKEGALGVGSALIYAPGYYAKTDELVALAQAAAESGGTYISHIRSESNGLRGALDEFLTIARQAHIPAEIYHMKVAGEPNWFKFPRLIEGIELARAEGLKISADMYTYTAGATGLDASMPPWVQEGGLDEWRKRLQQKPIRDRVRREMQTPETKWENLYLAAGGPKNVLLTSFKTEALKPYTGKTLAEVAASRGKSPEDTAMDLVVEDGSRVEAIYFLMSEENVRKQIALPWMTFGSDAASLSPEGVFLKSSTHPRAYGNFARLLGKYVRDEHVITLEQAVHRLSALPASNMKLQGRGQISQGNYADIVVFDPLKIRDVATYEKPQQFAKGIVHVFVNGQPVVRYGNHTGATPGRALRRGR